ncbi:hemagglutinin repeat-containing protein [Rhizobium sp. BR 314]|uniref:hemagglutinin repeat-containing protein n=1 Tax=Rhizobium sp. BR 314 TaxID=3040013 RepID=UPI0039BF8A1E
MIYQTEIVDGAPVLVPVVYLSAADRAKTTSAAMIAGNTVSIDAGSVDNSGAIAAADGMTINAGSIKANGGAFLAGGNMNLNAENGITLAAQTMNIGGQTVVTANGGVSAGGSLKMDAGAGSLTLSGTKVAAGGNAQLSGQTVTLGAVKQDNGGVQALVGTTVTTGGNLSVAGSNGVNIIASSAKVGGDLSVASSNGSVNIISAGVENTVLGMDRLSLSQGGTITTTTSQIQQGSSLIAGGAMLVSGNQGVLIGGSTLDAGGNLGIVSTNGNIAIAASQDQTTSQSKTVAGVATGYKGGQSSSTAVTSNASSITSKNGNVIVQANTGNISVIGSDIDAKGGVANLIAKGDVTIGEAVDTASSSSSSGKAKRSETTTTAEGSSISGQTGVNISSTGGDVTISASHVKAGDATHTADANIQAAGNIVIASGKDTDETTSDSKKSGFLSSSKTHTHTHDEDTVGSSVSASGDITVNAGSAAVVSGSSIMSGGSLSLSGSTVTVMGAEEEHESDKQTKKSGIGVGSGGGFISIYGSHSKTISESSIDSVGSKLSAGQDVNLTARTTDLNIIGSSVNADRDINLSAARDVNITPGAESASKSEQDKRSGFGLSFSAGNGGLSVGIGMQKTADKTTQDSDKNSASSLTAGRDLNVSAGNNVNLQGAQASAERDVSLVAGNDINLLSAQDRTNYEEMHEKTFAGLTVSVGTKAIAAVEGIMNSAERLTNSGGVNAVTNTAIAGLGFYQAYKDLKNAYEQLTSTDPKSKGLEFSVSATLGVNHQESSSFSTTTTPVVSDIRAGRSITMEAEKGSIIANGAQIAAGYDKNGLPILSFDPLKGDIFLSAANGNIDLNAAAATSNTSSKNSSYSAGIGVGWSCGTKTGCGDMGVTVSGSYGKGNADTTGVNYYNSHVGGTGDVTIVTNDLTLKGATVSGNSVTTDVKNLTIESQVDTATAKAAQLNVSGSLGTGGFNASGVTQRATGDAAIVSEQSGIHAGTGGLSIDVSGQTTLAGGLITSEASGAHNSFSTGTLTATDIDTHSIWKADTYGGSIGTGGLSIAPPVKAGENKTGQALSAIGGNIGISITDPAHQTQDISSIRRDTDNTNTSLPGLPDLQNILREQYKTQADLQAAQATIAGLVGDIASNQYENAKTQSERDLWKEGGVGRAILHAVGGGILGGVNGWEGALKGALGGASSSLLSPAIADLVKGMLKGTKYEGTQEGRLLAASIGQSLAAGVGGIVGGGEGASYGEAQYQYNYLKHAEIELGDKLRAQCKTNAEACNQLEQLSALDQARDDQLEFCKRSETTACVNARFEVRQAAAEMFDAIASGTGPVSLLDQFMMMRTLSQATAYFDASDPNQGTLTAGQWQKLRSNDISVVVGVLADAFRAGDFEGMSFAYRALAANKTLPALLIALDVTGGLGSGSPGAASGNLTTVYRSLTASDGTTVLVPVGYRPLLSTMGATAGDVSGLPAGFARVVDDQGNIVIAGSNGAIYGDVAAAQRAATTASRAGFNDLATFRVQLGLPPAGTAADKSTLAVIEINGQKIYGVNAHGQPVSGVNAISSTHAEIDALNQIKQQGISVYGQDLTLYVDRAPCAACGTNGGIRSMVEQLGLKQLTVVGPDGPMIITPR